MLSIPIPFVVSLLLTLLAVNLYFRYQERAITSCIFLAVCAATTSVVGLRWGLNWPIFSYIQPVLASLIPVLAWQLFSHTSSKRRVALLHLLAPILVCAMVASQRFWSPPLDAILTVIYLLYGIALLKHSNQDALMVNVSFSHWEGVKKAQSIAGWMLLFSASIDAFMSLDFAFNGGQYAPYILTVAHLILLPILSVAVVTAGVNTQQQSKHSDVEKTLTKNSKNESATPVMSEQQAREISAQFDYLMTSSELYLDPDLTLSKLSRKLLIPAKQISTAINLIYQQNITKVINEYRIQHAKQAILNSDETITQIFMSSGFQTKSNFNREFARIVGMTPSEFRKQNN